MSFQSGTRLGPYEILAPIGAGGMGEVYRGRDTRLDRQVAIKILPEQLAQRTELRERFEREARAVAALNHPNVCTLFDVGEQDGTHYLVMEHIDGETLEARLKRGPLSLDEALRCAGEIADALDKAHRQGVVHRDLKPGNIMLAKSGSKLLDFGLARLKQPNATPAYTSNSTLPTSAGALTAQGTILGTLQYMAPEQLEGLEADARTDIFALGGVLYETVTGRKPFEGRTQVGLIGSILEREPAPIKTVLPSAPPSLEQLIRRCLAKDPDQRWQSAADVAAQLKWIAGTAAAEETASTPATADTSLLRRRLQLWMAVTAVLFVATAALLVMVFYRPAETIRATRFQISAPDGTTFESALSGSAGFAGGSISPDGRRLVFTARDAAGKILLWLRPMDSVTAQALPGTEDASLPFWSPDSQQVGFFAQGKLKRIDIAGGSPQVICEAASGRGGAWNADGVIVFAADSGVPLSRVSATGGTPAGVTTLKPGQRNHRFPSFLPDGKHFIYDALVSADNEIFVGGLDAQESTPLLRADSPALYSNSGHVLFVRQGTLFAQSFDTQKFKLTGEPIRIAEQVATSGTALAASVSANGTMTYRNGTSNIGSQRLQWVDRAGKVISTVGAPAFYMGIDASPDGAKLIAHRHEGNGGDVWLVESGNAPMTRVTFDATQDNNSPIWSPDGSSVAYASTRTGKNGLYRKPANGTGTEEKLLEVDAGASPVSWSADGKLLVYSTNDPQTGRDIWAVPVTGERKPFAIVQGQRAQVMPQVSRDGKWLAYLSDESGRYEVYVTSFPSGQGRWQLTTQGSSNESVRWRADSKELFYTSSTEPRKMMAIPVNPSGTTFQWGEPQELFVTGYVGISHPGGGSYQDYVVSPNGQRFLIPHPDSPVIANTSLPINVILNWTVLLSPGQK